MKPSAFIVAAGICYFAVTSFAGQPALATSTPVHQSVTTSLAFTKNMGQWPDSILYRASAGEVAVWFTARGIYYQFTRLVPRPLDVSHRDSDHGVRHSSERDSLEMTLVKAHFVGASTESELVGLEEQPHKHNYFLGQDPATWRTGVPSYSAIVFKGIYPGVDATFRGIGSRLSYELTGTREALAGVRTALEGAVVESGRATVVSTCAGEKRFQGPLLVTNDLTVNTTSSSPAGGLTVIYSTYLGGNNLDRVKGIAVDDTGCVYVTGHTYSTDFPTNGPYQTDQVSVDIFVTKLLDTAASLVYSTYIGGSNDDWSEAIALDDQGAIYLTGYSGSNNYPLVSAYQTDQAGRDAIVTKLSSAGDSLIYSTYLGGSNTEEGWAIAIDQQGNAYITGKTISTNFPLQSPYQTDRTGEDAFVTKLSSTGSSVVYSTYLGGNAVDDGWAIAVDTFGCAYVCGQTTSSDFPTLSPYQTYKGVATYSDVFVTKFSAAGNALVYSTYLGGDSHDIGYGIKVNALGQAYVTGSTLSLNFPVMNQYQMYQGAANYTDAFVSKLSTAGSALMYSTYLGGTNSDVAYDIVVDVSGDACVTGYTNSTNFPLQAQYQTEQPGQDAFVARLSLSGAGLVFSTYLGGNSTDGAEGVALDEEGGIYVVGHTASANFPTFAAYQPDQISTDAFITKFTFVSSCCVGTTGNINLAGVIDLTDLSYLIGYLTLVPRPVLPCPEAANINNLGITDLTDLSILIAYLTLTPRPTLPDCP